MIAVPELSFEFMIESDEKVIYALCPMSLFRPTSRRLSLTKSKELGYAILRIVIT